jgi:S1-C subfamily serine protease
MGLDDGDEEPTPDGDDDPVLPRPDPSERPWFHPTELSSFVATPAATPAPPRPREWAIGLVSAAAAVAVTVLLLVAFGAIGGRHRTTFLPPVAAAPQAPFDPSRAAEVAAEAAPSIVTVRATVGDNTVIGTGVVFSSTDVMTAAHVVDGASNVVITTQDGHTITTKVVGTDPVTDVALLDAANGNLTFASLSGSDGPGVAEAVVAVGAQRSGPLWVGYNIVNKRNVLVSADGNTFVGLLQTGITPPIETSGGALLDQDGHVVGLLTSPPGATMTGLAVPIGMVRDVETQLDSSGKVTHGWLGILGTQDPTSSSGVLVTDISPGSPAEKAGLRTGDLIVRAGGTPVDSGADLAAEWVRRHPGDNLDIQYIRDGQTKTAAATLNSGPFSGTPPAS